MKKFYSFIVCWWLSSHFIPWDIRERYKDYWALNMYSQMEWCWLIAIKWSTIKSNYISFYYTPLVSSGPLLWVSFSTSAKSLQIWEKVVTNRDSFFNYQLGRCLLKIENVFVLKGLSVQLHYKLCRVIIKLGTWYRSLHYNRRCSTLHNAIQYSSINELSWVFQGFPSFAVHPLWLCLPAIWLMLRKKQNFRNFIGEA